ncbi:MAG: BACON domain-containing protein [Bacteroidales bacterium]|nr:BACON domain-containing protein [Bacteroidales bacterium]
MKTFKILSFVAGILALTALASCAEKVEDPSITIEGENTVTLTKEKASFTVKVLSNRDWGMRFVGNTPDWIVAEPSTGKASKTPSEIKITVTENTGANRTASVEFYTGVATAMLTIVQEGPEGDSDGVEALTVQQFINKADKTTYYRLTGTVSRFNSEYCSFDLTDATGTIYVYSVAEASKAEWSSKIKNGGTVTIQGQYEFYSSKNQHEVINAIIESFSGGADVVPGTPEGDGSQASPYNVAAAFQAVKNLTWTSKDNFQKVGPYYVKGKVSAIDQDYTYNVSDGRTFGNARFSISDDGKAAGSEQFTLYNLDYLGGDKFVAGQTDIKVGDDVVIYAELMNYHGDTPENNGGYLYSLNGSTGGPTETVTATVTEAIALADNTGVLIAEAVVAGISTMGLVVADATSNAYIYFDSKTGETVPAVAVGDKVKVEATKKSYNGVPEMVKATVTKLSSGDYTYPEAKDLTSIATTYGSSVTEYIKLTGTLTIDKEKGYYNLAIPGVDADTKQGSISGPLPELGADSYEGQQITVSGYFLGLASQGKFINILVTNIAPADPDAKYCNVNPTSIKAKADDTSASFTIKANAAWTVSSDNAEFTVSPASGEGDATVNVTFSANEGEEARVANIKVTCADAGVETVVVLTQAKAGSGEENPFTNNVTWTLVENAYDNTSSGNSQQSAMINGETVGNLLKLGTSSKNGKATINIPAGTTKLAFYCLGWSGKTSKVTLTCGSSNQAYTVKANSGVAQNPPYTVTTTAEESYYEFAVPSTSATTINVESEGRVILWGINAY